jgi:hypothetical protein
MVNHALEEVVAEEQDIQARIKKEQGKASEWLDREKKRVSRQTAKRSASLGEERRTVVEKAEADASREVAAEVLKAEEYRQSLEDLPDQLLTAYLKKHLPLIFPKEVP